MSVHSAATARQTTQTIIKKKLDGEKISMLTSYDFTLAKLLDEAGVDIILIGDSASNVVCGNSTTLPITLDEMIFLAKGVRRAAEHALVVCDMPFGSYQISEQEAVRNAMKILQLSGADAVKLEGGEEILPAIKHMIQAGVPVIGIGAGNGTDGQVLVLHDMLGLNEGFKPKFLRRFAELGVQVKAAVAEYVAAVKDGSFPSETEQY